MTQHRTSPFSSIPAVSASVAHDVLHGAVAAVSEDAVVEVSGSAAVECLQGLLTNDLVAGGAEAFLYGALLTPKGMIISDMWIARTANGVSLAVPERGRSVVLDTFKRALPPRLALFAHKGEERVIRLVGPTAWDVAVRIGCSGDFEQTWTQDGSVMARPSGESSFALQIQCPVDRVDSTLAQLGAAGARIGDHAALELARIWQGVPRLGAEIDEKTLPQEVRFDELRGVSHSKGCYVGQETVARVHFRGHVNKRLMGLCLSSAPSASAGEIERGERRVGRVTSIAKIAPLDTYVALGIIRRAIEPGARVTATGVDARVTELPFRIDTFPEVTHT